MVWEFPIQVCILAGRHTSTCVALYNGAINAGVFVFLAVKVKHSILGAISWEKERKQNIT